MLDELADLPRYRRLQALALACRDALAVWERWRTGAEPIVYVSSIGGARLSVVDALPGQVLAAVDARLRGEPVKPDGYLLEEWCAETVIALQAGDVAFPEPCRDAYLAIYQQLLLTFDVPGCMVPSEQAIVDQIASAVDVPYADWLRDWRTRVWDAWASAAPPRVDGWLEHTDLVDGRWRAGDRRDRIGRWATVVVTPEGKELEYWGNRDVLALGGFGEVVGSDGLLLVGGFTQRITDPGIIGAAISDDGEIATYDRDVRGAQVARTKPK